jgi:hypothetical protein
MTEPTHLPPETDTEKGDRPTTHPPTLSTLGTALHLFVLLALMTVPWWLHFSLAWWAGLVSWVVLAWVYDFLFVPKGSLCTGLPFMLALCNFLVLLILDIILLAKWIFSGS